MASGMKYWLGLTALGCALIAIWTLPPAPFMPATTVELSHEEARYRALSSELRIADATLKRIRWGDSLSALVVADGLEGVAFAVPPESGLTRAEVEEAKSRTLEETEGLVRVPNMALGTVYQPVSHGSADRARQDSRGRNETFVGSRDGVNYCFRLRVASDDRVAENVRYDLSISNSWRSGLGPCLVYAAHGMPGSHVTEWLESGGIHFGLAQGQRPPSDEEIYGRSALFGFTYLTPRGGLADDKCLAGVEDACASIFLSPAAVDPNLAPGVEVARRSPAIAVEEKPILLGEGSFLLKDLEREFGVDRFHSFWTSQEPVDEAFRNAFGVSVGPWMVSWLSKSYRIDPPGPQLAQSTSSAALLTLAFFVFVAFLRNRKSTVV